MAPALAKVIPPEQPLPLVRLIRTIVRNPIEAWPKPVYEQPVFRSHAFGRETVFITEPDLIQEVLVEKADAFRKAESLRRALRPALGDAILTADGSRWRWQRRATAPIFRHERIRGSVPVLIAAAERTRDDQMPVRLVAGHVHPGQQLGHPLRCGKLGTVLQMRLKMDLDG